VPQKSTGPYLKKGETGRGQEIALELQVEKERGEGRPFKEVFKIDNS